MHIPMLEAISKMLEFEDEDTRDLKVERVKCAKFMLDKIIEGMKGTPSLEPLVTLNKPLTPKAPERHDRPSATAPSIEVDDERKIVRVHNAQPDTIIELDGKKYTPAQALGRTFQKGKIL